MFSLSKSNDTKSLKTNLNPYIHLCDSVTGISYKFFILLSIQIIALLISKSYDNVIVILFSLLGGLTASGIYLFFKREEFYNLFDIIIQSLLFGFFLPGTFPLTAVFLISLSTFLFYKVLTHNSNNYLNPASFAVIIAFFIGRKYFPEFLITQDLVITKNPSVFLISQGSFPVFSFDTTITNFLNNWVLLPFNTALPEGIISLFWDTASSIPAFRFNLLTLISSIVLFSNNNAMGLIPCCFIFMYALLVRLFAPCVYGGSFNSGDVILALLTSGTLFTVTFMIQFFGTVPMTANIKLIFGLLSGFIAFLIVGTGTSPSGMAYTIIIGNVLALPLRFYEDNHIEKRIKKQLAI